MVDHNEASFRIGRGRDQLACAAFILWVVASSIGFCSGKAARTARLDSVSNALSMLSTNLVGLSNAAGLDIAMLRTQAQALAEQQAGFKKALAEMDSEIDILRKAQSVKESKTNPPLSDLQNELNTARKELDRLAKEEARLLARTGNKSANPTLGRTRILGKEMVPLYVAFLRGRVLPVRSPYYRTVMDLGSSTPYHLSPEPGAGEMIGQATRLGGCLDLFLKSASPKTNYFHFWVCPDSISAFHAARQFVQANNYTYSWSSYNGGSLFPGGAGNSAGVRGAGGER
jgi:hypothetical protein